MDEGGGYDDPGAKVFCDEEGGLWYVQATGSLEEDWGDGAKQGSHQDDEDGGYAESNAAIELIP